MEPSHFVWRSNATVRFGHLKRTGDYAGALREMTAVIERDLELEYFYGGGNLSTAFQARARVHVALGDVESALADFQSARDHYRVLGHPFVGVCLRMLGREEEARAEWKYEFSKERLREITNMDALEIPLLLLWACAWDGPAAEVDKKAAVKRLNARKLVKSRLGWWPWEIAYFVLGEGTKEQIFAAILKMPETIRSVKMIQAHFHIAGIALSTGDTEGYRRHMQECVALGDSMAPESMLARFYVDKLPDRFAGATLQP